MHPVVYVYSDESGVFDKVHKDYFIYAGIAVIGQDKASILARSYLNAEKNLRKSNKYKELPELKASKLENDAKRKLYRIIKNYYKFIVVVDLKRLKNECFENRLSQQRYLDYAYKRGLKNLIRNMAQRGELTLTDEFEIKCYIDEHNIATNGKYNLSNSIYTEFKRGLYFPDFDIKPIATGLLDVTTTYCNSEINTLVRASDILANRALFEVRNGTMLQDNHTSILMLP